MGVNSKVRIFAIIGIDGSGKTTAAKILTKNIKKNKINSVYIAPFRYIFFDKMLNIIKRKISSKRNKNPFLVVTKKPFFMRFWPLLALFDNWLYYFLKIKPLVLRGKTIICDRYFFDFAISFEYYGYTCNIVSKIYLFFMPKPDKTVLLDVYPEIAKKRETGDSHSLEFFMEQRERYLSLAKKRNFLIINGNKSINEIQNKMISIF